MYVHTYIRTCMPTCAYVHTCNAWIKKFARMTVGCGVIHNSDVMQQSVVNKACVFAGSKHGNVYVMQYLMCTAENRT
jgi:hypothetical protein